MPQKDKILHLLQNAGGAYLSGAHLSEQLGLGRNAVWKAIHALQEEGYPIESRRRVGYRFTGQADLLTTEEVRRFLHTRALGHSLQVLPETDSTNRVCLDAMHTGAPHGTTIAANMQTAGRGQHGRVFCSPAGCGLYFSILLRMDLPLRLSGRLTAAAAVAVCQGIADLAGADPAIKWVNDILLSGKKVCGILTESSIRLESGILDAAVVGIGINVRRTRETMPATLQGKVTSLEEAQPGKTVRRAELLADILYRLEQLLPDLQTGAFLKEYRRRSCVIGKTLPLMQGEKARKVRILDISDDCGLVVQSGKGAPETIYTGRVLLEGE